MKPNPAVWFEIYVQNLDRAKKFYESVFQGKLERLNSPGIEMWAFPMEMKRIGRRRRAGQDAGSSLRRQQHLVYFGCEDGSVEEGRVTKSGGRIHKNKFSIGQYGFISLVIDTEGNMFGLHSMK